MKNIIRILILFMISLFLSTTFTSCSTFDKSAKYKRTAFKHKEPVPKKWVIHNQSKPIPK